MTFDLVLLTLVRALHVLGVVIWIGGVAMVTMVILPAIRQRFTTEQQALMFELIEHRFAHIAKLATLLTGLSGLYLTHRFQLWWRFAEPDYWWMHAMVIVWLVFSLVLFILEPLWLHRWFAERARQHPVQTITDIQRFHWGLLIVSLVTVLGAVMGSHGGL
ncbi:hypothetical protein [Chitinivorax sp. B]|uniref:hypothetical protein n=1 Tax=Chitinivorax sp. B TaxID=2502235 RepID=UPI0010F99B69|nr:hypothetical protein [Chitinivorax sp. B]